MARESAKRKTSLRKPDDMAEGMEDKAGGSLKYLGTLVILWVTVDREQYIRAEFLDTCTIQGLFIVFDEMNIPRLANGVCTEYVP